MIHPTTLMKTGKVRAIAVCVLQNRGAIFVFEGHDQTKGETFYRPLGGTIEFGEHSSQTVLREFREEINSEIKNLEYLGAFENIFIHEGQPGHEIVLVYKGDFADASMYERQYIWGNEDDGGQFKALWKPLADFSSGQAPLYPEGLLDILLERMN